ncbi:MAG: protein kinase, partial [Myxococcales bacterium]|nr:protein kinase [Myxococcales bacterium]
MLCNRCGSEVEAGAAECGNCGARLAGRKRSPRTLNTLRALEQRRQQAQSLDGSAEGLVDGIGDRFTTREIIGRGPTGVVYRAQDRHNDLTIALKVLHGELVADPDTTARALARSARLAHPNIVRLYDVGAEGGRVHLAMELLEGLTLRKVLELRREKRQRFGLAEVEPIVSQVVMALAHAHRHLAHGLLKPENIIILPDALKVTDFGLADALPREALVEAQRAAGVGAYLAPEFIKGAPVTPAVDLFALGALLYEMLTGRPYAPGAPTVAEATGLLSAGAAAIDAVIARATHADPTVRFADVERFSEALSGAVDVEGGLPDDDEATRRV